MASVPASNPPLPAETLPRGSTVGRYVIVDVVGHGGMGVVYAAYDSQLDRKLAIKLLRPDLAAAPHSQEGESRLLREAQAMARLSHPNVVTVHDVGTHEGRVFLAMEFVDGVTLRDWLRTAHPFRERLRVIADAGKGLAAAHAVGLVHRDFKPDNVIVAKGGRVVVLDFGLARAQADTEPEAPLPELPKGKGMFPQTSGEDPLYTPLTRGGKMLGTVGYMAPELGFAETANALTDQFSFAATSYVALYGERPFPSTALAEYLTQVHDGPKEPAPGIGGGPGRDVPLWVRRIVLRGLEPEAKDRFSSVDAMLAALGHDPATLHRRLFTAASVLVGALATVMAIGYAAKQRQLVCAEDLSELGLAWGTGIRTAMTTAFEKSGAPEARASADRIAKKFDEFAGQWAGERADACRAARVQKSQPEDVFRLRNDCLDRERTQLASLTAMLVKADAELVNKSVEIAYGLPQTSWCSDVPTLRASAGLPDDPRKRAQVVEVRAKVAEAESKSLAGKLKEAQAAATEAVALARTAGDVPTLAEALHCAGRVARSQGAWLTAVPLLREALFLAESSGVDSIAVRAGSTLAFITGPKLKRADEPRIWLDTAHAALKRMGGGNEELELAVMHPEASLLNEVEWRPELALPVYEKIVATTRRLYGPSPKTQVALHNLGDTYVNLGEMAKARSYLEESVAMAESLGGPTYGSLGVSSSELGKCLVFMGEFALGEKAARRAIAVFQFNGMDYWQTEPFETLSWVALVKGDTAAAVAAGEQTLALFVKSGRSKGALYRANLSAAFARIRDGHAASALPLCAEALEEQEKEKSIDPRKLYRWDALRCEGEALIALGRAAEAIPYLERSLPLHRRSLPGDYARVEFALARALAASHREPARARELAKAAHDDFARTPFLAFDRNQVDGFLAKEGR